MLRTLLTTVDAVLGASLTTVTSFYIALATCVPGLGLLYRGFRTNQHDRVSRQSGISRISAGTVERPKRYFRCGSRVLRTGGRRHRFARSASIPTLARRSTTDC